MLSKKSPTVEFSIEDLFPFLINWQVIHDSESFSKESKPESQISKYTAIDLKTEGRGETKPKQLNDGISETSCKEADLTESNEHLLEDNSEKIIGINVSNTNRKGEILNNCKQREFHNNNVNDKSNESKALPQKGKIKFLFKHGDTVRSKALADINKLDEVKAIPENQGDVKKTSSVSSTKTKLMPRKGLRQRKLQAMDKDSNNSAVTQSTKACTSSSSQEQQTIQTHDHPFKSTEFHIGKTLPRPNHNLVSGQGQLKSTISSVANLLQDKLGELNMNESACKVASGRAPKQMVFDSRLNSVHIHSENIEASLIRAESGPLYNADRGNIIEDTGKEADFHKTLKNLQDINKKSETEVNSQKIISVPLIKETGTFVTVKETTDMPLNKAKLCTKPGSGKKLEKRDSGFLYPNSDKVWIKKSSFPEIGDTSQRMVTSLKAVQCPSARSAKKWASSSYCSIPTKDGTLNNHAGKLPDEIVTVLQNQASKSRCSVLGSSDTAVLSNIAAKGTGITQPDTNVASDFMLERLVMWRKKLNQKSMISPEGKNDEKETYAEESNGVFVWKTETIRPEKIDKPKIVPATKTKKVIAENSCLVKQPAVCLAVKSFGSSSSLSPDIYDMFARKGKSKLNKGSTATKLDNGNKLGPVNTIGPILKKDSNVPNKQQFTPLSFHGVGYTSSGKQQSQSKEWVETKSNEKVIKQTYTHLNKGVSPRLSISNDSQNKQSENFLNKNGSCPAGNDPNTIQSLQEYKAFCPDQKPSYVPEFRKLFATPRAKSAPAYGQSVQELSKRVETNKYHVHVTKEPPKSNKTDQCSTDTNVLVDKQIVEGVKDNTTAGEPPKKSTGISLIDKVTDFMKNVSAVNDSDGENAYEHGNAEHEPSLDTVHETSSKSNAVFSKISSQVYFKIPGDDNVFPVKGNVSIPSKAEFFLFSEGEDFQQANIASKKLEVEDQTKKWQTGISDSDSKNKKGKSRTNPVCFDCPKEKRNDSDTNVSLAMVLNTQVKLHLDTLNKDNKVDTDTLPKSIEPLAQVQITNKNKGLLVKKSFKEIVDIKRDTKKRIEIDLSNRRFTEEAQCSEDSKESEDQSEYKTGQTVSFLCSNDTEAAKAQTRQRDSTKSPSKVAQRPKSSFAVGSKFEVVDNQRPKTSRGGGRGRGRTCLKSGNKRGKPKVSNEMTMATNIPGLDGVSCLKEGKSRVTGEDTDCSYQIYSALRRLSISASPNKSETSPSKQTIARQRVLRSHVRNNTAKGSPGNKTKNQSKATDTPITKTADKETSSTLKKSKDKTTAAGNDVWIPSRSEVTTEKKRPQSQCYVSVERLPESLTRTSSWFANEVPYPSFVMEDVHTQVESNPSFTLVTKPNQKSNNVEKETVEQNTKDEAENAVIALKTGADIKSPTVNTRLCTGESDKGPELDLDVDENMLRYLAWSVGSSHMTENDILPQGYELQHMDGVYVINNHDSSDKPVPNWNSGATDEDTDLIAVKVFDKIENHKRNGSTPETCASLVSIDIENNLEGYDFLQFDNDLFFNEESNEASDLKAETLVHADVNSMENMYVTVADVNGEECNLRDDDKNGDHDVDKGYNRKGNVVEKDKHEVSEEQNKETDETDTNNTSNNMLLNVQRDLGSYDNENGDTTITKTKSTNDCNNNNQIKRQNKLWPSISEADLREYNEHKKNNPEKDHQTWVKTVDPKVSLKKTLSYETGLDDRVRESQTEENTAYGSESTTDEYGSDLDDEEKKEIDEIDNNEEQGDDPNGEQDEKELVEGMSSGTNKDTCVEGNKENGKASECKEMDNTLLNDKDDAKKISETVEEITSSEDDVDADDSSMDNKANNVDKVGEEETEEEDSTEDDDGDDEGDEEWANEETSSSSEDEYLSTESATTSNKGHTKIRRTNRNSKKDIIPVSNLCLFEDSLAAKFQRVKNALQLESHKKQKPSLEKIRQAFQKKYGLKYTYTGKHDQNNSRTTAAKTANVGRTKATLTQSEQVRHGMDKRKMPEKSKQDQSGRKVNERVQRKIYSNSEQSSSVKVSSEELSCDDSSIDVCQISSNTDSDKDITIKKKRWKIKKQTEQNIEVNKKKDGTKVRKDKIVGQNDDEDSDEGGSSDRWEFNDRKGKVKKKKKRKRSEKISAVQQNDSDAEQKVDQHSVEGFLQTQMKYYQIIRSATKGDKEKESVDTELTRYHSWFWFCARGFMTVLTGYSVH